MDHFSKWFKVYALPNQEANTVAEVLIKGMLSRLRVILALYCDQGQ